MDIDGFRALAERPRDAENPSRSTRPPHAHRLQTTLTCKAKLRHWLYMEKRIKTAQVNLRLEPALKEAAEKAAEVDRRSLTSLVEKLLVDHLRTRSATG